MPDPLAAVTQNKKYLSYYPHWLTDYLSPVFRIFSFKGQKSLG